MHDHDVVIVGAGPTGLMLAGELALAGIDVTLLERRPDQTVAGARALGITARTIEVLDQRGIADRFLSTGQVAQVTGFAFTRLDISDFPTRHGYGLAIRQKHVERLLADWVRELGVEIQYDRPATDVTQDAGAATVSLADGTRLRSTYLVGCDGGRSLVRRAAGIAFPGWEATTSRILAEVEMDETPPFGVHRTSMGLQAFGREQYEIRDGRIVYGDEGPIEVMVTEPGVESGAEPTLERLRGLLVAAWGTDYGVTAPTWISRFTDATRQAERYRNGRVLLAGDAAHIHSPIGGQGLSTGVQDAVNLGWKLAQVVRGLSPETLLDSYHTERHPVGARVLEATMAQVALHRDDERTIAAREILGEIFRMDEPRRHLAGRMSGLDIRYDLGIGHPLLGRRMPDLDLEVNGRPTRVFEQLRDGMPLLVEFTSERRLDASACGGRVRHVCSPGPSHCELPVIGEVALPAAVLVRPDGHVAWTHSQPAASLEQALAFWFGAPAVHPQISKKSI